MKRRYPFVLFVYLCLFFFYGDLAAQNTFTIGSGTNFNSPTDYPAPYGQYYTGGRHVSIYRRQELIDSGWTTPRLITQLGFNVVALNATVAHQGFTIKMKFDPVTTTLSSFPTGMTTVYTSPSEMPVLGWNMKTLTTPMVWDTTKGNIIVEVCFSNGVSNYTENASTEMTSGLPPGSSYANWSDAAGNGCSNNDPNQLGSWSGSTSDRPNIRFNAQPNLPMTYDLSFAESIDDFTIKGASNQRIVKFMVNTTGTLTPLNVTSIDINTTGTTDATGDVSAAHIYYTGLEDQFSTTNLFGTVAAPNGPHTVTATQQLKAGTNYFWIVYDVKSTATEGNMLDAEVTSVTVAGTPQTPTITAPAGAIRIGRAYNFDGSSNEGFVGVNEGGLIPNEWQRGVPLSGPTTLISSPNCWGTNLAGDFSMSSNYSLVSPAFLVTDTIVNFSFQQWFDFTYTWNGVYADFDYQVNNGGWSNLYSIDNTNFDNSSDAWQRIASAIITNVNDTIQFRWHFQTYTGTPGPGWYLDDFMLTGVNDMPQYYASGKVAQQVGAFKAGRPNIDVLRLEINAPGTQNPLYLTDLEFNTNGSTTGIINNAKVYYTGTDPLFSTATQVGLTVTSPSGTFTVTDSVELAPGMNHFWLTYDVSSAANMNDKVDAECSLITISTVTHVPDNSIPDGYREAGRMFDFDTVGTQSFAAAEQPGTAPNQWEKGVPTIGPSSAFSGTECWATNLGGNFAQNADYWMQTPSFIATDTLVYVGYENWFNLARVWNDVYADFQYQVNNGGWSFLGGIDNTSIYKSQGWEEVRNSILVNIGDTVQFRWNFSNQPYSDRAAGWYIDDVVVGGVQEFTQSYASSEGVQTYKGVGANAADVAIMQVEVNMVGTIAPLTASSFDFNTASSVSGIISNASLYYTGNVNKFSTADMVGTTVSAPSGTFSFSEPVTLSDGKNYFWLAYSLNGTGLVNDSVDAEFTQVTVDGVPYTPVITAPAGQAMIATLYNFDTTSDQGFLGQIDPFAGANTNFEHGVPTTGPSTTYSGDKCWATMLHTDYGRQANCNLTTAPVIAITENVTYNFKQWFDFAYTWNNISASFQYQVNNGGWNTIYNIDNSIYANSNNQWQSVGDYIPVSIGDTLQFRWSFQTAPWSGLSSGWYIDDFSTSGTESLGQLFVGTTARQNETPIGAGTSNQVVLRVEVETLGDKNPMTADAFEFNTNGSSTTPSLITDAKLYATGSSDKFSAATQYGTTVAAPSGIFSFTGAQPLNSGKNYFWLTYTVDAAALLGDSIDAEYTQLTLSTLGTQTPVVTAPAGNKKIGILYNFEAATDEGFMTTSWSSVPSEWQRGTPSNSTTITNTPYSGTKVWKTNLNGVYSNNASSILQTPIFVATGSNVQLAFQEALNFQTCCDFANIEFQVNNTGWNFLTSYNNTTANWAERNVSITVNPGDTVQFQFRMSSNGWDNNYDGWMIDDVVIGGAEELQMSVVSADIYGDSSFTSAGFNNQTMLRINVITAGSKTPVAADYFKFNTTGTTNVADIVNAKVYYGGSSKGFVPSNLFGTVVPAPSGSFTVTGSQTLVPGDNFFWLVYDVAPGTPMANLMDAEIDSVGVNAVLYTPSLNAPLGARKVTTGYNFEAADDQRFTTEILNGTQQQWERGTPSGTFPGAPATAYSGSNCWATNLAGGYALGAEYALVSPVFVANSADVEVSFRHFFKTDDFVCGNNADLSIDIRINNGSWSNMFGGSGVTPNWEDFRFTLGNAPGDTVQVRWVIDAQTWCSPQAGWYIDDMIFSDVTEIDVKAPEISYAPLGNTATLVNRALTGFAQITDFSGVDTNTFAPRIYYKKYSEDNVFGANNNTVSGWKYAVASNTTSPFSFTIDYSLLNSALAVGDTIQYFVTAQDVSAGAYVSASPADGFSAVSVDAVISAPAVPNQYYITLSPLSGPYNVGAGQVYTTITAAINDANMRGVSGAVTFNLTDNSYSSGETFPIVINNVPGTSATNTITIKPTLTATSISGSNVEGIFKFNQARYVKLNGAVTGSNKDLTIENTYFSASPVVWFSSNGTTGCQYDTVMNCNIKAGTVGNATVGISFAGAGFGSQASGHHHIAIINNSIYKTYTAIYADGSGSQNPYALTITDNYIGSGVATERVKYSGIECYRVAGANIRGNTLYNFFDNNIGYGYGIRVGSACSNINVENNRIDSLVCTDNSMGHNGIDIYTEAGGSNIFVANNFVSRLYAKQGVYGINIGYQAGGVSVYNNTINLTGSGVGATWDTRTAALFIDNNTSALDIRNNILSCSYVNTSSSTAMALAFYSFAAPSSFTFIDYNNYRVDGPQAMLAYINSPKSTLGAIRTATGKDVHSSNEPVFFVSSGDLHLTGASIGNFGLAATPLVAVPLDIDGQTRSLVFPYKGADENATPLPVKLSSFIVSKAGSAAGLKWTTASEFNNSHFVIERSVDMRNFVAIGQVKGKGNSNTTTAYAFTDKAAGQVANKGMVYYRLRQVDFNNASEVSEVRAVNFNETAVAAFTVYPNPFVQSINFTVTSENDAVMNITVTDLQGRTLVDAQLNVPAGTYVLTFDKVASLSQGIYMIRTELNGEIHTSKLIKTEQ